MKQIQVSPVDLLFANGGYPVSFALYYPERLSSRRLRAALRKLSGSFWPMFGEYRDGTIRFAGYAEGASFEETSFREPFAGDATIEALRHEGLPPRLRDSDRLFLFRLLHYENGSVALPTLKHLCGDGYSYFYFLSALAAVCREGVPLQERLAMATVARPHHRRRALCPATIDVPTIASAPDPGPLAIECEAFARSEIKSRIRNLATGSDRRLSVNDLLASAAVRKFASAPGNVSGESFRLSIPIDVRPRIKAYGPRFFGNGLMLHTLEFDKTRLAAAGQEDIAGDIRDSMPTVTPDAYSAYLRNLADQHTRGQTTYPGPFDPDAGCLVTNISRLPTHKLDFGAGPPSLAAPLTEARNTAVILSNRESYLIRLAYQPDAKLEGEAC